MTLMSSDKSFYRYQIDSADDLSNETFDRRRMKAANNEKKFFCFEFSYENLSASATSTFFKHKVQPEDLILISPSAFRKLSSELERGQLILWVKSEDDLPVVEELFKSGSATAYRALFQPETTKALKTFVSFVVKNREYTDNIFWRFLPYNSQIENSITASDIVSTSTRYAITFKHITGLEIYNSKIPKHYEMEPENGIAYKTLWSFSSPHPAPTISVVIPTFNNGLFLSNVVWHLLKQNISSDQFEVIIADDGSLDQSGETIHELIRCLEDKINISYIYWSKKHPLRGDQFFFRSGLARNLASRHARGEYLLFLDSDMLVPPDFISTAIQSLKESDLIQFQRFHIHQGLSKTNPSYGEIKLKTDTYIEESSYWSQLFFAPNWASLSNHWKYTCTYALGLKKSLFIELGMFKKYYISYGFEDTDLGYEAFKRGCRFELVKTPLLHLTAYDQMQYKNSFRKRVILLRVTAELFFLQHLDKTIFELLGDYFRFQKPLKSALRDLFS